jgi:hypothetical protein
MAIPPSDIQIVTASTSSYLGIALGLGVIPSWLTFLCGKTTVFDSFNYDKLWPFR